MKGTIGHRGSSMLDSSSDFAPEIKGGARHTAVECKDFMTDDIVALLQALGDGEFVRLHPVRALEDTAEIIGGPGPILSLSLFMNLEPDFISAGGVL